MAIHDKKKKIPKAKKKIPNPNTKKRTEKSLTEKTKKSLKIYNKEKAEQLEKIIKEEGLKKTDTIKGNSLRTTKKDLNEYQEIKKEADKIASKEMNRGKSPRKAKKVANKAKDNMMKEYIKKKVT